MPDVVKKIGLSLGADVDWPLCFEGIVGRLGPLTVAGRSVGLEVERLTIEPFDLRQPCRYDVVVDRLTHWYHPSREWIKKSVLMDGLYVFNNPWSLQSMEKHTAYAAMMHLGLPVPDTWMVPPKAYEPTPDLEPMLQRYARWFDLGEVGRALGYPMYMKPYDGGAWAGVSRIEDEAQLEIAYEQSGRRVMHLQRSCEPFDLFIRAIGLGPQVRFVRYDPAAPLHERYTVSFDFLDAEESSLLADMVLTINAFFGWDFNSCESVRQNGVFHPIDFANACPDSQVTSLHYHFPWMVKANIAWAAFCAATERPMRRNLDWAPFYAVAERGLPYREALAAYAAIARERLDAERFAEFRATALAPLDEVAWEFFGSDTAREAVRLKVQALYPPHEVERFTEHFWGMLQFWRKTEADRIQAGAPE
ncbi:MAG TPA: hypothetical protein VHQ65_17430 [Thermoanaerobaculia bacterium]|nr:hypothetical protein [Thermoanaerobaculia bacterium]